MTAATEFDIAPLSWVKNEIDQALTRADQALHQYTSSVIHGAGDLNQIRLCRNHLHQARGALTIVGLDGVRHVAEALEALLEAIEKMLRPAGESTIQLAHRSLQAIARYLDDLLAGQPNHPLRLRALYEEIQKTRGIAAVSPSDLFYPDLGVRPPSPEASADSMPPEERQRRLRLARARFQKGLLAWLRHPQDTAGASDMRDAVRQIEATQAAASAHAFWWVANGLMTALAEGTLADNDDIKPLCARIDLQIRRYLEGSTSVAERLMRDALYRIAHCDSTAPVVIALKQAYRLEEMLAAETAPLSDTDSVPLRQLREAIDAAEAAWNHFCAGTAQALPVFHEQITAVATLVETLGHTDYRRLAQAICAAAHWLKEDSTRHSEGLATEIATGILLAKQAQDNFPQLGGDFAQQVDLAVARIHRCIAGLSLQADADDQRLDTLSRQAQEKQLTVQIAKGIQNHLALIEPVLEAFFLDTSKRDEIGALADPLHQIEAALSQLGEVSAVAAVQRCADEIRGFADPGQSPADEAFERIANTLALIGFFADALPQGIVDFEHFAQQLQSTAKSTDPADAFSPPEVPGEPASEPGLSSTPTPGEPPAPPPPMETLLLSRTGDHAIDTELLGIFLEEAREVLDTIDQNIALLHDRPHDIEVLTALRRAFHTLKGSGRMVDLKAVGDAAWAIEQTLNLWLRQALEVSAALLTLIENARTLFGAWISHLETGSGPAPETTVLIAAAESLQRGAGQPAPLAPSVTAEPRPADSQTGGAKIIPLNFPARPPRPEIETPQKPGETPELSPASRTILSGALLEIFQEEAGGHLATLRRELPVLEAEEAAPTPHEMYRAAHTLAGISATVGFRQLNQLGHALEYALLRRDLSAHPGSLEALGVIRRAIDEIELILSALADQHEIILPTGLIDTLEALYPAQIAAPNGSDDDNPETCSAANSEPPDSANTPEDPADSPPPRLSALVAALPPLNDEIDEQLLSIFIEEAQDLTQSIAALLRAWHENPQDDAAVASLARLLHTLKGSARMAGAMNLGEITHTIETRIADTTRAGTASLETIDDIRSVFDDVQHIIDRLQQGEGLESGGPETQAPSLDNAPPEPQLLAGASAPPEESAEETPLPPPLPGEAKPALKGATLRVCADLIDRLANEAGELSIARTRIEGEMRSLKDSLLDLTENVIRLRRQLREVEIQAETRMQSRHTPDTPEQAGFDPLEFDRFTQFQELTRMMAESVNDVATVQQNLLRNLDDANAAIAAQARLNRTLQNELMAVRMVPFGHLSDRLYRVVRQTAKALGKRVNLEISGGRVELDRSVLDKMSAPLEHLLRNAIAHGLESSDVRRLAGKPESGEITLTLVQEGNDVILSLSDDGAGLDYPRIRERAIAAGLLEETARISDEQLASMIFTPGFSTAAELSQIAGRGIGMDVVKNEVSHLGGRVEVTSQPGQGTTFRLFIPLTLALTKALLVRVGNRRHALPAALIEQVLDLKDAALAEIRSAGGADWQGNHYPYHFLPHLLGDPSALPERHRQYWLLLLRSGTRRIAVQVDELLGSREIVIKNIGPQLARVIGIDGATVLGGGEVVLIVNPVALAARAPIGDAAALSSPASAPAHLPTVMVVDDSLTVRKVTGRMLAREGYQVITARDGVEAMERLIDIIPDVMLVDIEMPRLDGFDLTRNIRGDERLRHIPIIMITSRTAEKHRRTAFDIGVDHFLGKPFQEEELLGLVAACINQGRAV